LYSLKWNTDKVIFPDNQYHCADWYKNYKVSVTYIYLAAGLINLVGIIVDFIVDGI
jgi:hypothetical protein